MVALGVELHAYFFFFLKFIHFCVNRIVQIHTKLPPRNIFTVSHEIGLFIILVITSGSQIFHLKPFIYLFFILQQIK